MRPLFALAALALTACSDPGEDIPPAAAQVAQLTSDTITVYKTPTCGCCANWVDHVRKAGYHVVAIDQNDLTDVKKRLGVSQELSTEWIDTGLKPAVPFAILILMLLVRPRGLFGSTV